MESCGCPDGEIGTWPHCYYPNYLRLNTVLANATINVHNVANRALSSLTITPAQWSNVTSYAQSLAAHLSMAQTAINESLRQQVVDSMLWQPVSQPYLTQAASFANRYGFDPNTFTGIVEAAMPIADTTTVPSLQQQIMSLQNTQGLDNLANYVNILTASVTVQNGICGIPPSTASQWMQTGADLTVAGVGVGVLAPSTGPAAPFVEVAGDAMTAYGGIMWLAGWLCQKGY